MAYNLNVPSIQQLQPLNVDANPNPPSTTPGRNRSRGYQCITRLTWTLIVVIIIISSVVSIAWSLIKPHDPSFRLDSFSVSNITISNSQFMANYSFELLVNNTNKKVDFYIDNVKVDVFYEKQMLSERVLEQIWYVGNTSRGVLKTELGTNCVHSVKNKVFRDLSDDWSRNMVNFKLVTYLRTRFEFGFWPPKERFMQVLCMNLAVEFFSTKGNGKLLGGGKDCMVNLI